MDGQTESLHDRWVKRAEAAYQWTFGGRSGEELVTLTERKQMAMVIAAR
jgi:hypothetical protein